VPEAELPTVSVVVPVCDGLDDLARCVDALLAQDYPADRLEVVVVDNGSAVPPGPHLPADPRLRLLREDHPGSYAARNTGVAASGGEVVAFTDADCTPDREWVREVVAALAAEPRADMVGGAIDLDFPAGRPITGPDWYEQLHGFPQQRYVEQKGFSVTANMATWRSVLDRVGEFDTLLPSGGDADWGRRVCAAGGRQRYAAAARVRHPARTSWRELRAKQRRVTESVAERTRLRRGRRGGRLRLLRLLAGHLALACWRTVSEWRQPVPDSVPARVRYLVTYWRVTFVVCGALGRRAVVRR
jgi:glycosyltransferase involved in cell wall biosynthesis